MRWISGLLVCLGLFPAPAAAQTLSLETLQARDEAFFKAHLAAVTLTRQAAPFDPAQGSVTLSGISAANQEGAVLILEAEYARPPVWVSEETGVYRSIEYQHGGLAVHRAQGIWLLRTPERFDEVREGINHRVYPSGEVEDLEPPTTVYRYPADIAVGSPEATYGRMALGMGIASMLEEELAWDGRVLTATGHFGRLVGTWIVRLDQTTPLIREASFTVAGTSAPHIVVRTEGVIADGEDAIAAAGVVEIHSSRGLSYTLSASASRYRAQAAPEQVEEVRERLNAALQSADSVVDTRGTRAVVTHPAQEP